MKKIAIIAAILFVGSDAIQAQAPSNSQVVAQSKLTTNAPNKNQEPAINSNNTGVNVAVEKKNTVIDNSGSVAPQVATKAVVKPVDNSGSVAPVTEKKAVVKTVDNSGSVAPVTEKKVETKLVPSNSVNSTNTNVTPAEAPIQQPVENKKANTIQPVNVVTNPILKLNTTGINGDLLNGSAQSKEVANGNKLPEVKIDNSKQVKLEEVPASVVNPTTKSPDVPTQSGEKAKTKSKD